MEKITALEAHKIWKGKLEIKSRCEVKTREALALAYTPGVADACLDIKAFPENAYTLTRKWNTVAVITDGSAVLGLGNIGSLAGLPVMEGKAILFKEFGGVDAIPILLDTQDTEEIIKTVKNIAPSFGGINLEDISAPRCFEIERRLIEELDIPVFHDDQHGTAIVVLAGLINSLKLAQKKAEAVKVVLSGPGAAGTAITNLLLEYGFQNIILCDEHGTLYEGRDKMDWAKTELSLKTNREKLVGNLADAVKGTDIFIGVSVPKALKSEMVKTMNDKAIVFAMANPVPEILPDEAKAGGAFIAATGRSDYPNQINNLLVFPGLFRGVLDSRAKKITVKMKLAAAKAIADLIPEEMLSEDYIIPSPLDEKVSQAVSRAVFLCEKNITL